MERTKLTARLCRGLRRPESSLFLTCKRLSLARRYLTRASCSRGSGDALQCTIRIISRHLHRIDSQAQDKSFLVTCISQTIRLESRCTQKREERETDAFILFEADSRGVTTLAPGSALVCECIAGNRDRRAYFKIDAQAAPSQSPLIDTFALTARF